MSVHVSFECAERKHLPFLVEEPAGTFSLGSCGGSCL